MWLCGHVNAAVVFRGSPCGPGQNSCFAQHRSPPRPAESSSKTQILGLSMHVNQDTEKLNAGNENRAEGRTQSRRKCTDVTSHHSVVFFMFFIWALASGDEGRPHRPPDNARVRRKGGGERINVYHPLRVPPACSAAEMEGGVEQRTAPRWTARLAQKPDAAGVRSHGNSRRRAFHLGCCTGGNDRAVLCGSPPWDASAGAPRLPRTDLAS